MPDPEFILTRIDVERLSRLVQERKTGFDAAVAKQLDAKLKMGRVIPTEEVPPDLVTMNSWVVHEDERTGEQGEVIIAYPRDEDTSRGRASILTPLCAGLLGLKIGQSADWPMPGGRTARLKVVAIKYQPEKEGDFHL